MATTARGIEYPASTDAPRVWEDMQALAETTDDAIDAIAPTPGVTIGLVHYIPKGTAENVTSSTTMQDDDALFFTLVAGRRYILDFNINASGSNAGDLKTQWSVPGDSNGIKFCHGPASVLSAGWVSREDTNGSFSAHAHTTAKTYHMDTNGSAIREWGWIESATGGLVTLQWAQNASNATPTSLGTSCFLLVTRVS